MLLTATGISEHSPLWLQLLLLVFYSLFWAVLVLAVYGGIKRLLGKKHVTPPKARSSNAPSTALFGAAPVSRGVFVHTQPIGVAVEEKIVTAFVAMSVACDTAGQVTAACSLV